MPKRYPFLFKGNFAKTSRQSFEVDHPPKRKKPWRHNTFLGMEMSHFSNSAPWGDRRTTSPGDGCAGRVLRPLTQVPWERGEGGLPKDGDVKEFQTEVSGAVGNVTYSMDPFWSEVNENGDIAAIDPITGLITLEENVCQGPYPPWIIYFVCDDCGCSSGTIWLEDSSGDCLDCEECDCDGADDCVADCCMTESGTPEEMDVSDTKQFTCGGGGVWSVSGTDVTIDQTGLVTTGAAACGLITVSNTVCQDRVVRVQGAASGWIFVSSNSSGCPCSASSECATLTGATPFGNCQMELEVGEFKYQMQAHCYTTGGPCGSPYAEGPLSASCDNPPFTCMAATSAVERWGCL